MDEPPPQGPPSVIQNGRGAGYGRSPAILTAREVAVEAAFDALGVKNSDLVLATSAASALSGIKTIESDSIANRIIAMHFIDEAPRCLDNVSGQGRHYTSNLNTPTTHRRNSS